MDNIIEVKDISKNFGTVCAVERLSFTISKGSCFGLIGPNGSGKTTTIRMITNIILPDRGEINLLVDNQKIGYLPEERGLYPRMKVKELLLFFAQLKEVRSKNILKEILYWFEKLELEDVLNRKVSELSKGMQQKLQIIVTIIHNPDFVILDEPFIGLDPISVDILRNVINEFKKKGKSILLSTHWMDQAEKLCDEICLINKGKKILAGELSALKKRYQKNELLIELKGNIDFISNIDIIEKVKKHNGKLQIKLKKESNYKDFLKTILEKNELIRFEFLMPSLEEIFIEKVKQNE